MIRVVTRPGQHRKALSSPGGILRSRNILVVKMIDRPGELAKMARGSPRGNQRGMIYIFGKAGDDGDSHRVDDHRRQEGFGYSRLIFRSRTAGRSGDRDG